MKMKEERAVKSANEVINFEIENIKFIFSTFQEKGIFYTFIHKVEEDKQIKLDSPLIMQFENESMTDYFQFKKAFGSNKNKFIEELKDKTKIENQFSLYMKSNINMSTKWFNPEYSTYVLPSDKNNYSNNNGTSKSSYSAGNVSIYKKCQEIKPVILLEMLQKLGYISSVSQAHNTQGEEFWTYSLNNGVKFKTSVKTKSYLFADEKSLYDPVNEIYNDVFHTVKGYGKGSIGLIGFLGDKGLFQIPLPGEKNKTDRNERSQEFIISKIYPHVDQQDLANDHEKSKALMGQGSLKVISYSRLPFKNNTKINDIKNYLANRELSINLIDKLISEDLLYSGNFSANKLGRDAEHKIFYNVSFFKLTDRFNNESGAEKLSVYEAENSVTHVKEQKISKVNTHPVMGNGFRLMSKQPTGTFIAEAVIDVLSAYELFKLAGINPDQFNYIATQGCNNLKNFLSINAGFGFETNKDYRPFGEIFGIKEKIEKEKMSQAKIENYNKSLKGYDYYFINTNNDKCNEIMKKMPLANKILGTDVKILNKTNRNENISYAQFDKEKSVFLDETAFDKFFHYNNVAFEYEEDTNKYKIVHVIEKMEEQKLNTDIKNSIVNKMMSIFGSTTLMFGLDNDEAGLKYRETLNNIPKYLDIKVHDMYPQTVPGKENKTDINDVLRYYKKLTKESKLEEAATVLENFVKGYDPTYTLKKNKTLTNKP